ncbi:MAG: DoxX family protein [Acidobacteriia bacterium]|nr:DoxX family protein [Terriglobia bacterium]
MFQRVANTTNDFTLTILRVVLGVVVFAHGAQKVLGWFGGRGFSGTMGFYSHLGFSAPLALLAIAVEFFGGLALIAGFLGRIAALGIICKLIAVIWHLAWQNGFFMNWTGEKTGEGFEYHLLAIALGLAILLKGSGAISVDKLLSNPNPSPKS